MAYYDFGEMIEDEKKMQIAISEPYRKARKMYVLFSAILLAWEFIGISIPEFPSDTVKVQLNNPGVAPIILMFLVLYFGYRSWLEWTLHTSNTKNLRRLLFDYRASNFLAIISITVFFIQRTFSFELADLIVGDFLGQAYFALFGGVFTSNFISTISKSKNEMSAFPIVAVTFLCTFANVALFTELYNEIRAGEYLLIIYSSFAFPLSFYLAHKFKLNIFITTIDTESIVNN